ncbi:DUF6199 family natural product biosynthesis protein [Streptomyces sp. NPDC058291]|jgi:predicted phage tail protein|uniref:DUF6199 family natural product biosynthesis protein n=1 Tax=Streptomyces sp. NPDC058291 TaxID=3346427 RepID=UPI0036E5FE59
MNREAVMESASGGGGSAVLIPVMCAMLIMGLVQVIRPQLLWKVNRNLQRGWVKDPDATEPTGKGYAMQRVTGVLFLAVATWMLVQHI